MSLQRETFEETGLTITVENLVGIYCEATQTRQTKTFFTFTAFATGGNLTTSSESLEVKWYDCDKAARHITDAMQKSRFDDALNYQPGDNIIYRVFQEYPHQIFESMII